jgi:hypothetical protein
VPRLRGIAVAPDGGQGCRIGRGRPHYARAVTDGQRSVAARLVAAEIERLRAMSYEQLRALVDKPRHEELRTAAGEFVIRETQVLLEADGRDLQVHVDVFRPRRTIAIGSLADGSFVRRADGSSADQ